MLRYLWPGMGRGKYKVCSLGVPSTRWPLHISHYCSCISFYVPAPQNWESCRFLEKRKPQCMCTLVAGTLSGLDHYCGVVHKINPKREGDDICLHSKQGTFIRKILSELMNLFNL